MTLIAELQRRNVFRVGLAYLALGWIVTQVTATVAPLLHLPDWIAPVILWVGVVGFPFVLLFSWVYELTPEGLKREHEVDRSASVTHLTARRLDMVTIGLVLAAILVFVLDPRPARETVATAPAPVVAAADANATPPAPMVATAAVVDPRSIAVLPFVDMSAGKDQDYMSDGIAEELLNLLAKIPELKVTSRSSAFAFKGEKLDLAEVATKLRVAHILEGSVRTSGNRVRITAQLIDARSDQHLWSESYDRTLDDIFAVQDEIAGAVVGQLKLKLLGEAPKARVTDSKAYALYLQARELGRAFTAEGFAKSNTMLQQVLEIDPGYAEAWERLGTNHINETAGGLLPEAQALEMAREAYAKALAIDPNLVSGLDGMAWIQMYRDNDFAAAAASYKRVLELAPTNVDLLSNATRLQLCLGRIDAAVEVLEWAVLEDPANAIGQANLADVYLRAGRVAEGVATLQVLLGLGSERLGAGASLGFALLLAGDYPAALEATQKEASPVDRQFGLALALHSLGRKAEADAALQQWLAIKPEAMQYERGALHAWRGEPDAAFEWLEQARQARNLRMCGVATDPILASLHADPRWPEFLRRAGRAPEQLDAIPFAVRIPL